MANVALGRPVVEEVQGAGNLTDGDVTNYDGESGYAQFAWPDRITVDLEEIVSLECVRLLLWDGMGRGSTIRNPRQYCYRLLVSEDGQCWTVLHDTRQAGTNGWQEFRIHPRASARFIRVHGMFNTANLKFHIVQLEAHDSEPPNLTAEIRVKELVSPAAAGIECRDGLPLQSKVNALIARVESALEEYDFFRAEPVRGLLAELRGLVTDIGEVEGAVGGIRRQILKPVLEELESANKLGEYSKWGYRVGLAGGLLAIVALIVQIVQLVAR